MQTQFVMEQGKLLLRGINTVMILLSTMDNVAVYSNLVI